MRKLIPVGPLILAAILMLATRGHSELTDAQKRELFLESREDIHPVPRATATPQPRPEPARPKPHHTPHSTPTPAEEEEETPSPTPEPEATPEETPARHHKPAPEHTETPPPRHEGAPEETPAHHHKPAPEHEAEAHHAEPSPTPAPTPTPKPEETPAIKHEEPVVVKKSGVEEDQGLVPPPERSHGWFFLFGGGPKYKYITPSVRAAIDKAPVKRGRWKYIVVHNSGTRQGNAHAFDIYHRTVRHMPNGLAYHFVIGNGTSSGDGEIEIGNRWKRQINGGHVHSDYLNNISLGICLVGDFNRDLPTKAQIAALQELINYLRKRCGRANGHDIVVYGHKQINPVPTDCPGDRFPLRWLNRTYPIPRE